jgi:hypothetical protein
MHLPERLVEYRAEVRAAPSSDRAQGTPERVDRLYRRVALDHYDLVTAAQFGKLFGYQREKLRADRTARVDRGEDTRSPRPSPAARHQSHQVGRAA